MPVDVEALVVGSGPLGTAAARRLAERGQRVLLLEQGPEISDPPGSHIRNTPRFQKNSDSYVSVATSHLAFFDDTVPRDRLPGAAVTKVRGGQGVIWTNLCPRCDALWDAHDRQSWDAYFGIAESYLGVQTKEFEASVRQQRIRERLANSLAASDRRVEALPVAGHYGAQGHLCFTAPYDILAGAGEAAERIEILHAEVRTLVHKGGRVAGVTVGNEVIEADEFVVAGGAIGTPQLLHRSGIRPKALGRWLSYHPILITQMLLDQSLCAAPGLPDREPRLQIPPTLEAEWYSIVLRDVSPFAPQAPDLDVDPNRLAEIQVLCPVDIDEQNGIRFDAQSEPTFEMPLSAADQARLDGAVADADRISAALGRYRSGCEPIWMPFGFAHMTGTTRMSAVDDGTGVADFKGRVWGFDNLRLATNGLIPTRMAVNPTLTGVALAIGVADAIADA